MTSKDPNKLSPVFWQEMIGMSADALKDTLESGFKKDPVWMIDQAVCASKNVRLASEEGQILSAFCYAHADSVAHKNLSQGLNAAVTGLDSLCDDDDTLNAACRHIVDILQKMAVFNRAQAIDTAVATKSQIGRHHPLYGEIMTFLVDELDNDDYDMFKHISQNSSALTSEGRDKFITRLENLVDEVGYGMTYILQNFCLDSSDMPVDDAMTRASALLDHFSDQLPLQVIVDEAPKKAPPKPENYTAKGNVITLHPRRDPQ